MSAIVRSLHFDWHSFSYYLSNFHQLFLYLLPNPIKMKTRQELASELNDVLERNYDAVNGYKDAARDVENVALKKYFTEQAIERVRFGQEIREEIILLGQKPVEEGSTMGLLHRTWMNFKTNLTHDNEKEVCEECIKGENAAVEEYDKLLEETEISPRLRAELLHHKAKTLEAITDLMLIREAFNKI